MSDDSMMIQGLSRKRWIMLAMLSVAFYINEVPLYGQSGIGGGGAMSDYIEYFLFFPLFYTSIYWLEEVGHYQTVLYAMVF